MTIARNENEGIIVKRVIKSKKMNNEARKD